MRFLLLVFLLLPNLAMAAAGGAFTSSRDSVRLVSATNAPRDGSILLGLAFRLAPGWHIYWSNPGDAGLPPRIELTPPAKAGPLAFPPPEFDLREGIASYVLSGAPVIAFTATGVGGSVSAQASWLVCQEICVPEHAQFTLDLPGGASAEAPLFATPRAVASPFAAAIAPDGTLRVSGLGPAQVRRARFFPASPGRVIAHDPQPLSFGPRGMALRLSLASGFAARQPLSGVLEITDPSGATQSLTLTALPAPASVTPLRAWLGLAFLGGLLLNLMPCVFPVLAMKALSVARMGGAGAAAIRREALGYTAGVLIAMLAVGGGLLGLRGLGADYGWGFQFQSPVFVAVIAWLVLAIGLNLAGVFEVSLATPVLGRLQNRSSFFAGLVAVATATPCTAPFMAGAVAVALAAPLAAALGVFVALGLGLAAPFLLLAIFPVLARALPRPGAWMLRLQRALSLPMFASFLWLAWVMTREAGAAGTALLGIGAALLALALALRPLRALAPAVLLVLPLLHRTAGPAISIPGSEPYSAARLAELRQDHRPVFIDLTAAWCITCLVNERTTLASREVREAFADHHVQLLVGDWTNRDDGISRLLRLHGRDGVPLYLYYPAGSAPVLLPQLLTPSLVLRAIAQ